MSALRHTLAHMLVVAALVPVAIVALADGRASPPDDDIEEFRVEGHRSVTATSSMTVPAASFELMPLESGGQMLEAVPNLVTAQHTGGGKAEQYYIRGFDADHGTDLAVFFDGVPINLRSHAHGQGFLDLHFVTKETIDALRAHKGPYFARFGDFATAAAVEYRPFDRFDESMVKFEGGSFDTFRAVGIASPGTGAFADDGPAQGFLSFEAYHTDGPFLNDEDLWRYSALARGSLDLTPDVALSGHLLGYHGTWNASGLVPQELVYDGTLSRFGSLDPTEGGESTRVQGKLQVDWTPSSNERLSANAYVVYYDLELFSNFTYFLVNDDPFGDGIVQRDDDRIYAGGRVEYTRLFEAFADPELRLGLEGRYDHIDLTLATQTRRTPTGCQREGIGDPVPCASDEIDQFSLEPYVDLSLVPLDWVRLDLGLRFAWFHFDGWDRLTGLPAPVSNDTLWLPKANLALSPFSPEGLWPSPVTALEELELFANFGIGYHSNDARAVFVDPAAITLPQALGGEVGLRTRPVDRVEIAIDYWWLALEDEFVFVGDEGTTESAGRTERQGVELVATLDVFDWLYVRGDVAYTSARITATNRPVPQAPRFIARASTGLRWRGFAGEFGVRHLGDRYASEDFYEPALSGYTVLDLGVRYVWRFLEVGLAVENLADTAWRSSEFDYDSRPIQGGASMEDFHFTPGNPRNVRGWVTARF